MKNTPRTPLPAVTKKHL